MSRRDFSFDKDLHGNITTFGPFICFMDQSQKSSPRKSKQIKTQSGLNLSTYMTSYLFIFWCGKYIYVNLCTKILLKKVPVGQGEINGPLCQQSFPFSKTNSVQKLLLVS